MKKNYRSFHYAIAISLLLSFFLIVAGCVSDSNQVKPSVQKPVEKSVVKQAPVQLPAFYWKPPSAPVAEEKVFSSLKTAPEEGNLSGSDTSLEDKEISVSEEEGTNKQSDQELLDSAMEFCQVSSDFWDKGDLEKALEALDEAYLIILKVNAENSVDILQQREDLRFTVSKRVMEIYASRFIVANGLHKAIPLNMNRHVERAISLFQGRERDNFLMAYRRSGKFRPAILKALKESGLPEELSWLPLIESGFKTQALSRARALGLWQFIASTGYRYGLNRDRWVDERMDPEKATSAAIAYLKDLHQIFGDWYTVLAAYNCGEGRVLRLIKTQRISYLDHFWDLYEKLPSETAFYVPQFLAVLHILNDPAAYGFELPPVDEEIQKEIFITDKQVSVRAIAEQIGVSYEELKNLNSELRYGATPPGEYSLRVPVGKETLLASVFETLPEWRPPVPEIRSAALGSVIHHVRKGETLSGISKKYGTSVGAIAGLNGLRSTKYLKVGWNLKIPVGKKSVSAERKATPTRQETVTERSPGTYVVQNGDSLWSIANRFGTSTKAIMYLNRLKTTQLSVGQPLKMPKSTDSVQQLGSLQAAERKYTVMQGDSLYKLANRNGVSVEELLRMNGLNPTSTIFPGQVLTVESK